MEFNRSKLMVASFLTLVAAGFGFATRAAAGPEWEQAYDIGSLQFGGILGAGFLGFGLMIFFGGILVETFGYKLLLGLAFLLHVVSAIMLLVTPSLYASWETADAATATAKVFSLLYYSAFVFSIAMGLYEAVINPLIAELYPESKTHYLNILHAGWPGGMILGGLFAASFLGNNAWVTPLPWQYVMSAFLIVVLAYGILAFPERFPKTASSKSGSFQEVFSCFASWPFLVLIVLHGLVGYMELGVDSWMPKLIENLLPNAIIVLVYTSALMFILRFFAGPIVHRLNPIGLLLTSSIIACLGLLWLSTEITSVAVIFAAATFYSFGKAFLWPTMLAVAGERYPMSGAVAMGALGAAGMLTVGQIGGPMIGAQQGYHTSKHLEETAPETHQRYVGTEEVHKKSHYSYQYTELSAEKIAAANGTPVEGGKVANLDAFAKLDEAVAADLIDHANEDVAKVRSSYMHGSRQALRLTAYIPGAMIVGYLILLIYFKSIGGYTALNVDGSVAEAAADH